MHMYVYSWYSLKELQFFTLMHSQFIPIIPTTLETLERANIAMEPMTIYFCAYQIPLIEILCMIIDISAYILVYFPFPSSFL